jgi:amidase
MPLAIRKSFAQDFGLYWGMLSFSVEKLGKYIMSPQFDASSLDTLTKGLARLYQKNLLKTPLILYRLKKIQQEYAALFARYDVILSPVLAHTTPKLGYLAPDTPFDVLFDRLMRYVSFTPLNNVSGGPGISLPVGQSTQGLPIGVHVSANYGDERTLLEIAFALEQASPWRRIQDQ